MPAVSIAQQRLMGLAYAVKKGEIKLSKISDKYKKVIQSLIDNISLDDLKKFAKTKHKGLPYKVTEILSLCDVQGMGDVIFPDNPDSLNNFSNQQQGSGDSIKKKKSKFKVLTFKQFLNG